MDEEAWDDEEDTGPVLQVGIHVWATRVASTPNPAARRKDSNGDVQTALMEAGFRGRMGK